MKEEELFPAIVQWCEGQGYEALITHNKRLLSIPLVSYFPGKLFVEPDMVGLKDNSTLVAVEVEADRKGILGGLGQCLAYTAAADKVYLALPEDLCREVRSLKLFDSLKLGLLCVGSRADVIVDQMHGRIQKESIVEERIARGMNYNVDYSGLHENFSGIRRPPSAWNKPTTTCSGRRALNKN